MNTPHRVVIIGGGFGGLEAAKRLKRAPVQVTLLDRRNFYLFQALLYQVATGGLSPANIATPLRELLKHNKNTTVLLAEAVDIDAVNRRVILRDGEVPYETLVVAAGARHEYFGHEEDWEKHAPGLKTIEDATEIRRRILLAFEKAEREPDPERQKALLTFVVVGAGPTGVELAGTLAEMSRGTLRHNFRRFDPASARILLFEGTDRVLPPYPPKLSAKAARSLDRLGVTVRTDAMVVDLNGGSVTLQCGEQKEVIPTHTILWAAGVLASPLGRMLAKAAGAELDRAGRVLVGPDLTIPGRPDIFVIGDMAHVKDERGNPLPGLAPVAIQEGRYVARLIQARLTGSKLPPFRYRDPGSMATIGRNAAVANLGWLHLSGRIAWLGWVFIHLAKIAQFHNRVLVFAQWAWNYFTRGRSARLITGNDPFPLVSDRIE
jgi:NADH dehydrogenase